MVSRYVGENGYVEVDGAAIELRHEGLRAKIAGLTNETLRKPLSAVSGVHLKPATRLLDGHLTLGFDGQPAAELGMAAPSDKNTIMFRHKDLDTFTALHQWLLQVVQLNVASGVPWQSPTPSVEVPRPQAPGPVAGPAVSIVSTVAAMPESAKLGRREKAALRESFKDLALAAAHGDPAAVAALPAALEETRAHWRRGKLDDELWATLVEAVEYVSQDDVLTEEEESHLVDVVDILGLPFDELSTRAPMAFESLVVCRINDGRPPTLDDPPIITKSSEVAYGAFSVALMKEVVKRELRGGSAGVSIPIGGGVRFRTGGVRGRSVVVGSELVAADEGVLVVTSLRTVFAGSKKTLEFRHDKLVGMQQFTDGLQLNVSNRQTASLFTFDKGQSPTIASALISHAVSALA